MLIQAERPASRGCVCWVLIPHPELPAAGELHMLGLHFSFPLQLDMAI